MLKINISTTNNVGGVNVTESESYLSEKKVIKSFEDTIVNFILTIDLDFFTNEQVKYHSGALQFYSKEKMNIILKEKSRKKLKNIIHTGALLFNLMKDLNIKIHNNGFYFLAYLNDLYISEKTLN